MLKRIAIVGAGHIAGKYAAVLRELQEAGEIEVTGVADVRAERAERFASYLHCPSFSDSDRLLESVPLDILVITTPPAAHATDICKALDRSIDVLCEKPLTTSLASLETIEKSLRGARARLFMASKYRYSADVLEAKALLHNGAIGSLREIEICFASDVDMSQRWYSQREVSGGGVLMDNGPHAVDLARAIFGSVRRLKATEGRSTGRVSVEETVDLLLSNESGHLAKVHLSWAAPSTDAHFLRIHGVDGVIEVGWNSSRIRGRQRSETIGSGFDSHRAMKSQVTSILRTPTDSEPAIMTTDDALENVRAIASAYRSLQSSDWECVEP